MNHHMEMFTKTSVASRTYEMCSCWTFERKGIACFYTELGTIVLFENARKFDDNFNLATLQITGSMPYLSTKPPK